MWSALPMRGTCTGIMLGVSKQMVQRNMKQAGASDCFISLGPDEGLCTAWASSKDQDGSLPEGSGQRMQYALATRSHMKLARSSLSTLLSSNIRQCVP